MTTPTGRRADDDGAVRSVKDTFEERVRAIIKATKDENVKRIGTLEVQVESVKAEAQRLNTEANLLKGEMTAFTGSVKGLESNVRLWGKDINVVGDFLARLRGEAPDQLRRDIQNVLRLARRAQQTADRALQHQRAAAERGGLSRRSGQQTANVQSLTQASQAIDRLERRINRLVDALG